MTSLQRFHALNFSTRHLFIPNTQVFLIFLLSYKFTLFPYPTGSPSTCFCSHSISHLIFSLPHTQSTLKNISSFCKIKIAAIFQLIPFNLTDYSDFYHRLLFYKFYFWIYLLFFCFFSFVVDYLLFFKKISSFGVYRNDQWTEFFYFTAP